MKKGTGRWGGAGCQEGKDKCLSTDMGVVGFFTLQAAEGKHFKLRSSQVPCLPPVSQTDPMDG